jgi:uncharacterized Rossmann fold enzyme
MKYREWAPIYAEILADFGFDRARDEEAAQVAAAILAQQRRGAEEPLGELDELIRGRRALICGNAPRLERDVKAREAVFEAAPLAREWVVIAADGATSVLLRYGFIPDIVCTDLDGTIPDIIAANRLGALLVVHAHGDNMPLLKKVLPALNARVICTTQSEPLPTVYNFGGFTDGDRCVFLAKEFGARSIELIGFEFDDPSVSERKRKKLQWAKRLISAIL